MVDRAVILARLKKELEFLETGRYRDPDLWRQSFIFEDSHACTNPNHPAERGNECPLLTFVPPGRRHTPIPCRHIPLNDDGYTLDSMYRWNTREEIEATVRQWLKKKIAQFESVDPVENTATPSGTPMSDQLMRMS